MKQYGNSELSSKILENETEELNNKTMRNHVLKTQKKIDRTTMEFEKICLIMTRSTIFSLKL